MPEEYRRQTGLDRFVEMGLFKESDKYWRWGLPQTTDTRTPIPDWFNDTWQNNIVSYATELESKFGPFDGVMGISEGNAPLNTLLGMKEAGKLNSVFDSIKFFITVVSIHIPHFVFLGCVYFTT